MNSTAPVSIWWIRRDLRLADNQALAAALAQGGAVLPLFILDPVFWQRSRLPEKRLAFLLEGLRRLDGDLRTRGARLVVRSGAPLEVLPALAAETGAAAIFSEEDTTPYARRRDAAIAGRLPLHLTPGLTVFHPRDLVKPDGRPYSVFTPFSRSWLGRPLPCLQDLLPVPECVPFPEGVAGEPLPDAPRQALFPTGEAEAQRRLAAFLAGPVHSYHALRDRPDLEGTSGLSPYFRFGMLSARQAAAAVEGQIGKGAEAWRSELIWREFYQSILFHFPAVRRSSFREAYRSLPWINDAADLRAWQEGQTGVPFVDAAMRQLRTTGWMHNRARMVVASFLVKDLLIDWRLGEAWFMEQLIDGDLAANNGGWQWSAGTGTDAAPYFRVFNPFTQSVKFDPDGRYIRRWVPELARVPAAYLHDPSGMPPDVQRAAGCRIGVDYPARIIDHRWARERAIKFYQYEARQ